MTSLAPSELRSRTIRSLGWQLLGIGGQRAIQFAGLAAYARLVDEHDIGLFGIVMAATAAVEALTAFAGEQSQIHSARGAERSFVDTVFTVRLIRGVVVALLLAAAAPIFAMAFPDPDPKPHTWRTGLFLTLAFGSILDALQSPRRAVAMKELDFRRIAVGDFLAALTGTSVTIAIAYLRRDVWALVLGQLWTMLARSAISYLVAPHQPRLCLDRAALGELLRYTRGAAFAPFLLMTIFQAPAFILGALHNPALLAVYGYDERLAKVPEDLCIRVLGPVAIPAYSTLIRSPQRLRQAWLGALNAIALFTLPGMVALAWIGNDLPTLVFGPMFGASPGLFTCLTIHGGLAAATAAIGPLFWAIGEPHRDRRAQLVRSLTIYLLGLPLAFSLGVTGFAIAATTAMATAFVLSLVQARRRLEVRWSELWSAVRPAVVLAVVLGGVLVAVDVVAGARGLVGVRGLVRIGVGGWGAWGAWLRR